MSLKTAVASRITHYLTSAEREAAVRARVERRRRAARAPHLVEYFHQVDDPYSHLAAQALLRIRARYDVVIRPHLVGPPADWAAPERARLIEYARADAARLAARAGLDFTDPGHQPAPGAVAAASERLVARLPSEAFLETAVEVGASLWAGRATAADEARAASVTTGAAVAADVSTAALVAERAMAEGAARRAALGHFMSAMIHYGKEWYWGLDRLHYLESRLGALGARKPGAPVAPLYAEPTGFAPSGMRTDVTLHFYLSFRSPYTSIVADRVKALADAYGAELKLRFVLPMVMRGLPVPRMKGLYFALDTAREARRLGVPFGRIADPVGRPVERGYSLLPWARDQGRGYEYCLAFLRGVWAHGVDAGSNLGLRRIVEAAGLSWSEAYPRIGNDDWRAEAEANRHEMFELGLWGVPCFRVGNVATWGQDRLWVIDSELQRLAATSGVCAPS
jgi:2-hydroxychromene-2-carboxylate isomerase